MDLIASMPPDSISPPPRLLLRTRKLAKSFGSFQVLEHLELAVREGSIYGFLGRNGAGKTTAIQILMGIQKQDGGTIHLFGKKVKKLNVHQKQRIGYVSQEQFFYPWMSCNYLGRFVGKFYPTWDAEEFQQLMKRFNLPPNRKAGNLSQGMRVKLALALALAHRPRLLLLDEPTSGLDPAARREFLEIVKHQAATSGITTFFSSHIVEEVERIADRVGILEAGRLRFQGPIRELLERVRALIPGPDAHPSDFDSRAWERSLAAANLEILAMEPMERITIAGGEPGAWKRLAPGAFRIKNLSLEDIFLALTTGSASIAASPAAKLEEARQ